MAKKKVVKGTSIIDECLDVHNMSLAEFCKYSGMPRATFNTWMQKGRITDQGHLLIEKFIENKKLLDQLSEYEELKKTLGRVLK